MRSLVSGARRPGGGAIGSNGIVKAARATIIKGPIAADEIRLGTGSTVLGSICVNRRSTGGATVEGSTHSPLSLPVLTLPPPAPPAAPASRAFRSATTPSTSRC